VERCYRAMEQKYPDHTANAREYPDHTANAREWVAFEATWPPACPLGWNDCSQKRQRRQPQPSLYDVERVSRMPQRLSRVITDYERAVALSLASHSEAGQNSPYTVRSSGTDPHKWAHSRDYINHTPGGCCSAGGSGACQQQGAARQYSLQNTTQRARHKLGCIDL
jgi:hypothetical protein